MGRSEVLKFLGWAATLLAGLIAIGSYPTYRTGGSEAVIAMLAACGSSLVASLVGAVPILRAREKAPQEMLPAVMGSIVVRLGLAVVLAGALAWSQWFVIKPFLTWVAISHLALLIADTQYARSQIRVSEAPDLEQ